MNKKIVFLAFAAVFATAATVEGKGGWKPLFGADFLDAEYDKCVWTFSDGVLTASKDKEIWSTSEYENFILELEFKNDHETNSGVIVYCTDRKNWIPNAVEIQIADDYSEKWSTSSLDWQCGAIFGHLAANKQKVVRKPGEWNAMQITCRGQKITVKLNGKKVTQMDMSKWTSGTENPDGTKIPSWQPKPFAELATKGFIGLQGKHGNATIWFRNIKIKNL
ncbi:3-keto-disaccharide hydrolase [Candidatus Symbiothrix dinenymphae]|uniref:3-keto-disaccharide hydrolase n=1 Tax=Candidatus Symbiothrix dinenymphae TaxID=467085 RepID=UPI0006C41261|nr:DUF1080 domain-containing protein [Candidatus Symbiothrix dinenymphae]GAP72937.1 hypothetical protein SAMD00024442_5_57 [Candidatus Symbiothrix dinenymphae]